MAAAAAPGRSADSSVLRELFGFARRNPLSVVGGLVAVAIVFVALAAPWIAPRDPLKTNFLRMQAEAIVVNPCFYKGFFSRTDDLRMGKIYLPIHTDSCPA